MEYTIAELRRFLPELTLAAWSGLEVVIVRDGKRVGTLIHRGHGLRQRRPGHFSASMSYKKMAPIRSRELSDLGFE